MAHLRTGMLCSFGRAQLIASFMKAAEIKNIIDVTEASSENCCNIGVGKGFYSPFPRPTTPRFIFRAPVQGQEYLQSAVLVYDFAP